MRVALALLALAALAPAQSVKKLVPRLYADSPIVRYEAARDLGAMGAKARSALPELIDLLGDEEPWVRMEAGRALVRIGITAKQVKPLMGRLDVAPPEISRLISEALATREESIPRLIDALADESNKRLVREALYALTIAGRKAAPAIPRVMELTQSPDPATKKAASEALRRLAPWAGAVIDQLVSRLDGEPTASTWVVIRLLAGAGPAAKAAVPALRRLAASKNPRLATAADKALRQIDVVVTVDEALFKPDAAKLRAPDKYRVRFTTTQGAFVVAVERALAPRGADRFFNLVKLGYYDGAHFFRVIPNFVAQFGMHKDPKINAAWKNAVIEDDAVKGSNTRGTLCFAKAGPNSRTTQVFINLRDNKGLDATGFSPFGEVISGWKVVKKLHDGYGDQPDQQMIAHDGAKYLEREFPKLDAIRKAELVGKK